MLNSHMNKTDALRCSKKKRERERWDRICNMAVMIYSQVKCLIFLGERKKQAESLKWQGGERVEDPHGRKLRGATLAKVARAFRSNVRRREEPADGESFWQDKIPRLKIWQRKKKKWHFAWKRLRCRRKSEVNYLTGRWRGLHDFFKKYKYPFKWSWKRHVSED